MSASTMVQVLKFVTLLLILNFTTVRSLRISFIPNSTVTLIMHDSMTIEYNITEIINTEGESEYLIFSENRHVASLEQDIILINPQINVGGQFNITANFLGQTRISCRNVQTNERAEGNLDIIVVRQQRVVDRIFTGSVAALVSIIYINFACAINWAEFPNILKKPIGPVIGFCGQFIFMPLASYGLGILLFPGNAEMQLGMFFTGVAPGGGASNIWTVLLEGNISLSIIMTTISTIGAFAMMPLWIFTLGRVIFDSGNLDVPYGQISTYVVALIIPLVIGYLIQRYLKKVARFLTKILKGFSVCLILFIIVFAIVTNLYLFELFSWQIIISGMALPWLGFCFGYLVAKLFRQPSEDCITIALEIGIQNTGISIFLLRFALPQPQADLTTIAPVSVAMFTPLPLICLFIIKKIRQRLSPSKITKTSKEDPQEVPTSPNLIGEGKVLTVS